MKDLAKKAAAFITFDMPLQAEYIYIQFASVHSQHKKYFSKWTTSSTRQKLIATYWLRHVLRHSLMLFSLPAFIALLVNPNNIYCAIPGILVAAVVVLPLLILVHYWPYYSFDFLPKLAMVKEDFETAQDEQIEKCRQAQLSNLALLLVFYVFDKTSNINTLQCNNNHAGLLMKLYGVDKGSMKKNLELVLGKKRQLSPRKCTEIHNRFDEAIAFFEEIQFEKGILILKELEVKFQR